MLNYSFIFLLHLFILLTKTKPKKMSKIKTFLINNSQQPGIFSVCSQILIYLSLIVFYYIPAPFVQTVDGAIRRINLYPLNNSIGFAGIYPLDSDLSGGYWRQENNSYEKL